MAEALARAICPTCSSIGISGCHPLHAVIQRINPELTRIEESEREVHDRLKDIYARFRAAGGNPKALRAARRGATPEQTQAVLTRGRGPLPKRRQTSLKLVEQDARRRAGPRVYFAYDAARGLIKVGMSLNVERRICDLEAGCRGSLSLLGSIPGGRDVEIYHHRRLEHLHHAGEWFRATDESLAEISALFITDEAAQ